MVHNAGRVKVLRREGLLPQIYRKRPGGGGVCSGYFSYFLPSPFSPYIVFVSPYFHFYITLLFNSLPLHRCKKSLVIPPKDVRHRVWFGSLTTSGKLGCVAEAFIYCCSHSWFVKASVTHLLRIFVHLFSLGSIRQ